LAARAVTGHSASSAVLAEQVNERTGAGLSARTVRWHIGNLGLANIRNTLPQLVEALKKTPADLG
jgi:repressor of nif and glnA expression